MWRLPADLSFIAARLREARWECYLVGGAVRDRLLGRPTSDYDLASNAPPDEIQSLFRRVIPTGIQHGTVTILMGTRSYEITTFRSEGEYEDGRRPQCVTYASSIHEDLLRRDFTINAIAYDLNNGALVDPWSGKRDLKERRIKAVGSAIERLNEDGLRAVRACRFAAQLQFEFDQEMLPAIRASLSTTARIAKERICVEISSLLQKAPRPSVAFHLFRDSGLLSLLFPELESCVGFPQEGFHDTDLFDHLIYSCDAAPPDSLLRMAALLHDVGKPLSRQEKEGIITFHGHEKVSAKMAISLLTRYRFPKAYREKVSLLVAHHMLPHAKEWSPKAIRRLLRRVGKENWEDLLDICLADARGVARPIPCRDARIEELRERIHEVLVEGTAFSVADLAVNGHMLNAEAGIPKGPVMGTVLNFLLESILEDPSLNVKAKLLAMGKAFYDSRLRIS